MLRSTRPFWIVLWAWLVALVIVNPIGEFPLNDDWAYALSVKEWLETGRFHIIDWPAMSLWTHVAWGTLWVKLLGFSFTVLRLSTLFLAAFSVWVFDLLLRELRFSWEQRLVALVALVFNPLYFHLSATFMTDVPFVAFCIFSSYAYWRYYSTEKRYWWWVAVLLSVLAILMRQLGLLLPLAFGGALVLRGISSTKWTNFPNLPTLFHKKSSLVGRVVLALLGVAITYGSLQVYLWWLGSTAGLPTTFAAVDSVAHRLNPKNIWEGARTNLGYSILYTGGLLLPVWLLSAKWGRGRLYGAALGVLAIIFGCYMEACWDRLPTWNTLYDWGIGPMTLPDFLKRASSMEALSAGQGLTIKIGALFGALSLLLNAADGVVRLWTHRRSTAPATTFRLAALLFTLGYLLYFIIDFNAFDRYLITLMPFVIVLLPARSDTHRYRLWGALLLYVPVIWFSVAGTHDYMAWNRARWQALRDLEEEGVLRSAIDGGFEYNGWYQTHHRNPLNPFAKSWWFVDDDRFAIALTPYHNYEPVASYPFDRYLVFGTDSILTLRRPDFEQTTILTHSRVTPGDSLHVRYDWRKYQPELLPKEIVAASSGDSILHVKPNQEYALQYQLFPVKPFEQISMTFDLYGKDRPFLVVTSAPDPDRFYYAHTPFSVRTTKQGWQKIRVEMQIPEDYPSDTLDLYCWKQRTGEELYIRDLSVRWRWFGHRAAFPVGTPPVGR